MDRPLVVVNQFSYNGTLFASVENMITGDSNPMQNLRKNMKKSNRQSSFFWNTVLMKLYVNLKYFGKSLKCIHNSIFIQPKKTGLSWRWLYLVISVGIWL